MTMYCIAGLNMMHMLLHVESDCDVHDITGGRMWRIIAKSDTCNISQSVPRASCIGLNKNYY